VHNALLGGVALALSAVVLLTRLRVGFAVAVASILLVPGSLVLRNPFTSYALFTRVIVIALAVRLAYELKRGTVKFNVLRWTTVHTAFVIFLACTFVAGVVLADTTFESHSITASYLLIVDPFLFFVVALACVRAIGDLRWCLGVVAVALVATAGIGIVEHATGGAWGHFLFGHIDPQAVASDPLTSRFGHLRVHGGSEYPVQYAWVLAMLLPAMLAWLGAKRLRAEIWLPLTIVAAGVVVLAEYWSYSRTGFAAIGVTAVLAALAARDKRLLALTAGALALGVLLFVSIGGLQHGYLGLPSGPVQVRTERVPVILGIAATHPLHGIGLGGLAAIGLPNTDSTYLQLYGEAGLVGLVSGVALLVCCLACCARGLRASDRVNRLAAAAAVAGTIAMLVGGGAYDALRSLSSSRPFFLLIAIGLVAAERAGGRLPALVPRPRLAAASAVAVAGVAGIVILALAPVHYAEQYAFQTVSATRQLLPTDPVTVGTTYINSICDVVGGISSQHHGTRLDCRNPQLAAGVGQIRVQAGSVVEVQRLVSDVKSSVSGLPLAFTLAVQKPLKSGRDTGLAWAPFWLPVSVLLALVLVPLGVTRSHRDR
jgi:hypothetical protein